MYRFWILEIFQILSFLIKEAFPSLLTFITFITLK